MALSAPPDRDEQASLPESVPPSLVDRRSVLRGIGAVGVTIPVGGTGAVSYRAYDNGIGDRHSNRGPYTSAQVPAADRDALSARVGDLSDVAVRWFTTAADKAALSALIMDATHAFVADQQQSAEAYSWFRNNRDEVGALLDANAAHPGRSARNHLRWLADANAIARHRVSEVPAAVGLTEVAHRRAGACSLEDAFIRRTATAVAVLFAVLLVLCAYAAVTLVLAALVLLRRDA